MEPEQPDCLNVESISPGVAVVRFARELILSGHQADVAGDALMSLLKGPAGHHVLLDFANVKSLTSMMLAKLVSLNREAESNGRRLALFNLRPEIREVMEITRLTQLLSIYDEEREALDGG